MNQITMNDFFCGGGGFGLAAKQAGIEVKGAWDFDKYAVMMYKHNVDETAVQVDIREMTWRDIKKANIWSFGFPCTDLTKARMDERKKLNGEGSGMFYEVMRLLDEVIENVPQNKPDVLLVENVPELYEVMDILKDEFYKRGFYIKPGLYNSKWWGVPQSRERWFVTGFSNVDQYFEILQEQKQETVKMKDFLEMDVQEKYFYIDEKYLYVPIGFKQKDNELWQIGSLEGGKGWLDYMKRVYSVEGIVPTVHTCQGGHRQFKILDPFVNKVRKGTPREYARAQGFPEDYEIIVSDARAYKIFGNAVSVPLAKAHLKHIKSFLLSIKEPGENE